MLSFDQICKHHLPNANSKFASLIPSHSVAQEAAAGDVDKLPKGGKNKGKGKGSSSPDGKGAGAPEGKGGKTAEKGPPTTPVVQDKKPLLKKRGEDEIEIIGKITSHI